MDRRGRASIDDGCLVLQFHRTDVSQPILCWRPGPWPPFGDLAVLPGWLPSGANQPARRRGPFGQRGFRPGIPLAPRRDRHHRRRDHGLRWLARLRVHSQAIRLRSNGPNAGSADGAVLPAASHRRVPDGGGFSVYGRESRGRGHLLGGRRLGPAGTEGDLVGSHGPVLFAHAA